MSRRKIKTKAVLEAELEFAEQEVKRLTAQNKKLISGLFFVVGLTLTFKGVNDTAETALQYGDFSFTGSILAFVGLLLIVVGLIGVLNGRISKFLPWNK